MTNTEAISWTAKYRPLLVQFIKYGIAGAAATLVHIIVFSTLNETVFPADVNQTPTRRAWHFFFSTSAAFVAAATVAYLANRKWVFEPGRHSRWKEMGLFFLVAGFAYVIGTPLGSWLVARYPLNEYAVYVVVIAISVLVNFCGRKFVVFLR